MPAGDYDLLVRYWNEEPWGPYRDNLHAAIVANKIHNMMRTKRMKATTLEDYMLVDREQHRKRGISKFISWAKSVSKQRRSND